jgi:hypothetical protein
VHHVGFTTLLYYDAGQQNIKTMSVRCKGQSASMQQTKIVLKYFDHKTWMDHLQYLGINEDNIKIYLNTVGIERISLDREAD